MIDLIDPPRLSAQLGGIPEGTLAQWRYLGRGPRYIRVGKHVRYAQADVDAWLEAQRVETLG